MVEQIAIYGSGAFGQEVYLLIDSINKAADSPIFEFIGFFDDTKEIGTYCKYGKIIGSFADINKLKERVNIAIAVGSSSGLMNMRTHINNPNINFPNLLSPYNVYFDKESMTLGMGNIILSNSIISYDVKLGNFNVINTRVNFGHHVVIGDFNVLNPNVQLSGNTKLGSNNSLGLNSAFLPKKMIGDNNVVVPGSIIARNFKNNNFLSGNPAVNIKL
jgi:acyl-[acyl carrier protein]--UDP-N-acetylglucosamine O-acyltransferase